MLRFALSLLVFVGLGSAPVSAAIHRCVGPGGTDVFTDQPCSALSMPSRDMRGVRPTEAASGAATSGPRDSVRYSGPRGLVAGCPAASPEALLAGLETGLARRDVNYLSGLFLWTGVSAGGGRAITTRLRRLVDRELIELRLLPETNDLVDFATAPPGWDPYVDDPPPRPAPNAIAVRHAAIGGEYTQGEETRLAIRRHSECLWLAF